jgi:hypothetical protein
MKLQKVKRVQGNVVSYDYYKTEKDGYKEKITNMEFIELSVLEGSKEISKDTDFNTSNSTVGQFYIPKKSGSVIKAEKKLYNKVKKSVKKPNRINKLIDLIQKNCESITCLEDILKSSYDDSVIQLQIDLEESKKIKEKLVKKLSVLLHGKQVRKEYPDISGLQYNHTPKGNIHETVFQKNEKINPLYPFNTDLSIEQKRLILSRELGLIV